MRTVAYSRFLRVLHTYKYTQSRFMAAILQEKPVENIIKKKLTDFFQPSFLDVINESYMHAVPKGSETHFKVVVVTDKFENMPLIKRHRSVNELLHQELKTGVHALSIIARTPKQWQDSEANVPSSPQCLGGMKKKAVLIE